METVRAAEPADVSTLVELGRQLRDELRTLRGGDLWTAREARREPLTEAYTTLVARDDAHVVVGTLDGFVVGFGVLLVEQLDDGRRLGVVEELYVEPGARQVGVGEAVVAELVAHGAAAGCLGVDARALPGHRAAKNFFEGAGFTARALVMHRPAEPGRASGGAGRPAPSP